jgi:glycosyltransferase involved in cell wall biosynthesis
MRRTLRAWNADVMHLAGPFVLGAQGCRVGQSLGIPLAAHYQTNIERYARHFHLSFLAGVAQARLLHLHNRCQVNYAPTIGEAKTLTGQGMRRVRVSGRGVDSLLFHPGRRSDQVRRALLRPGEHTILLYVGRLSAEKNIEHLAPTLAAIPGARLILVGDGPRRAALEQYFGALPATFLGERHGEELATLYASADIFTFPSLSETFGQVVQEAMASGPAIVAFGAGGVSDLLRHGEEGLLCSPASPGDWFTHAQALAENPVLRARLSERARSAVLGRTWEAVFDKLFADYAALLIGEQAAIPSLSARISVPGLQSKEGMHSAKERIA